MGRNAVKKRQRGDQIVEALLGHPKWDQASVMVACAPSDIDVLVSGRRPEDERRLALADAGVEVIA